MQRFLAFATALLWGTMALAQTSPGFVGVSGGSSAPLTATALNNAFKTKQDVAGDVSTQHVTALGATRTISGMAAGVPVSVTASGGDDTAAVQAAVTALCAATPVGGTLYLPAGSYHITASVGITVPCEGISIRGAGRGNSASATVINVTGTGSAATINYNSTVKSVAGRYAYPMHVTDLTIIGLNSGTSATQTGAAIAIASCWGCTVERVTIIYAFTAISVYAGLQTQITDSVISQVAAGGTGILWYGYDGTGPTDHSCNPGNIGNCPARSDVLQITNVVLDSQIVGGAAAGVCIHQRDFAATLQVVAVICNQFSYGLLADCPNSNSIAACPQFISLFDFETEPNGANASSSAGIYLSDVVHANCHDCQVFGYNVTNDIVALSTRYAGASDIQIVGGKVGYAQHDCILASAGQMLVQGVQIAGCGSAGAGYWGVDLLQNSPGGTPSGAGYSGQHRIIGNTFCWETSGNGAITSHSGVALNPGNMDYNVVQGNTFKGCAGGVTDSSGGAHESVTGNVGP